MIVDVLDDLEHLRNLIHVSLMKLYIYELSISIELFLETFFDLYKACAPENPE